MGEREVTRTPKIPSYMFARKTGAELKVGDQVAKYEPDEFQPMVEVDEKLVEFVGRCNKGPHFRTLANRVVCYDKCAFNLVLK